MHFIAGPMMLGSLSVPVVRYYFVLYASPPFNALTLVLTQYAVAMSQIAPIWGAFVGALVAYLISIVSCSVTIAFVLKKLESRYTQLAPDVENKVANNQITDGQESTSPVKSSELTDVEPVIDEDVAVPLEEEIGEHKE